MKRILFFAFVAITLTGCADHVAFRDAALREPVGFWFGLWHGTILPLSWVFSLIDKHVAIYAIYNNGGGYDFGFLLGTFGFLGGGAALI